MIQWRFCWEKDYLAEYAQMEVMKQSFSPCTISIDSTILKTIDAPIFSPRSNLEKQQVLDK